MKPSRKSRSAKYRKAARRIERNLDYACCYALQSVDASAEASVMEGVFVNDYERNRWGGHWMAEHGEGKYGGNSSVQDRRVLALCFMAAMVEAGDA